MRLAVSAIAAVVLLTACSRPQARPGVYVDPALETLVPPGTTVMMGARVDALASTRAFEQVAKSGVVQDIVKRTKIDPRRSLWQVVFASMGGEGIVLARGKFADELLAPDLSREGAERMGYKGLTMFGNEQDALLFFNSSTIAIGPTPALRLLIDQRPTIKGLPAHLAPMVRTIPKEAHVWGVYSGGPVELPLTGNLANIETMLSMVENGTFHAVFGGRAQFAASLEAKSEQRSREVRDALNGLIALAGVQGEVTQKGPELTAHVDVPY